MTSWKLTLPCTRAEAEAMEVAEIALDSPPVLTTREVAPGDWLLEAFFEEEPDAAAIAAVRALAPGAGEPLVEPVADADWVTLSQAGLEPVRAGRFFVHTAAHQGATPAGAIPFRIEASRAFGTGHHETTAACLLTLDRMRARGERFRNLLDLGTGTGLLAFAAQHLWPNARATASDIDPAAVAVTRENAAINGVASGFGPGRLTLTVAPGLEHSLLVARAPYDLIIANILAGPLVELAPAIADVLAEGGTLLLSGLLQDQVAQVVRAYRHQGLRLAGRVAVGQGEWPALRLRKRPRHGAARVSRGPDRTGFSSGFGSW
jgi:ribosomal protein L11 methyltransferase